MRAYSYTHTYIKDGMTVTFPIHVASYSANTLFFKIIPPISTYFYRHFYFLIFQVRSNHDTTSSSWVFLFVCLEVEIIPVFASAYHFTTPRYKIIWIMCSDFLGQKPEK